MERVLVISLGGTIAMVTDGDKGAQPTLDADDLIAAAPGLADVCEIHAESFLRTASANLLLSDMIGLIVRAQRAVDEGYRGVVVTQGTDTLEETSFAAALLADLPIPIVFTGAMRNPDMAGADGPANLLAAVRVAASPSSRGARALVVMNGEIHDPADVRKSHTTDVAAFASPNVGPVGRVHEGEVEYRQQAGFGLPLILLGKTMHPKFVPLITGFLGDDGAVLDAVAEKSPDALVFEAFGGGHVPELICNRLGALAASIPVVYASRTGAGRVLTSTYGYAGSEMDLVARGCIPAGRLDGRKARVLLDLLVMTGVEHNSVESTFRNL